MACQRPQRDPTRALEGSNADLSRHRPTSRRHRGDPRGVEKTLRRRVGTARNPTGRGGVLMTTRTARLSITVGDINGFIGLVVDKLSVLAFLAGSLSSICHFTLDSRIAIT